MLPLPSFFFTFACQTLRFFSKDISEVQLWNTRQGYLFEKVTEHRNSLANLFVLYMLNTVFKLLVFLDKILQNRFS